MVMLSQDKRKEPKKPREDETFRLGDFTRADNTKEQSRTVEHHEREDSLGDKNSIPIGELLGASSRIESGGKRDVMVDDGVMVESDGGQIHAGETLQHILCNEATSVILLQRTLCSDTSSVTLLQHILCSKASPVILLQHKSSTGISSALSLNPPHWSRNHPPFVLEAILFSETAQLNLLKRNLSSFLFTIIKLVTTVESHDVCAPPACFTACHQGNQERFIRSIYKGGKEKKKDDEEKRAVHFDVDESGL
ncbi:hypothetical protein C8R45DRAFT_919067 [Mycena sanguinolenta]|nr:hypothetical protein C8R45DRAFT_919067 [Mycena sanguinolenta]